MGATDGGGSPVTQTWSGGFTAIAGTAITDHNSLWGGAAAQQVVSALGSYASSFTDESAWR